MLPSQSKKKRKRHNSQLNGSVSNHLRDSDDEERTGADTVMSQAQSSTSNGTSALQSSENLRKMDENIANSVDNERVKVNGMKYVKLNAENPIQNGVNGGTKGKGKEKGKDREGLKTRSVDLEVERKKLPVWNGKDRIISAWRENDILIIIGETGSGKTTQIPQFILSASPHSKIAITQPRRLSATTIATRVAQEVGCVLGETVGYSIRFENVCGEDTKIKFLTDGTLLQEMLTDPLLEDYETIVIDEAHERSLRSDMLLGFLKAIISNRINQKKKRLKLVVMSATLDADTFMDFFDQKAQILYVQGRMHDVKVMYMKNQTTDYLETALSTICKIHLEHPPGDILVFLPGQEEISSAAIRLLDIIERCKLKPLEVIPLYANLPPSEQARAFTPCLHRKVILSTNIAETGVTVPGIKYVVDPGLAKVKVLDSSSGVEQLSLQPVSQSSAMQRAGRAGRESAGTAFRLYTETAFKSLEMSTAPEIQRVSLDFAALHMLASGVKNLINFPFLDRPDDAALGFALRKLHYLGAIKSTKNSEEPYRITSLGERMSRLPLTPTLSRVLLAAFQNGCAADIISLVSLLEHNEKIFSITSPTSSSEGNEKRKAFMHREGDHMMLLNVLEGFEQVEDSERKRWCFENGINFKTMKNVLESRRQLKDRCERLKLGDCEKSVLKKNFQDPEAVDIVLKTCTAGYLYNSALKYDNGFRSAISQTMFKIHPASSLHNRSGVRAVIFNELLQTSQLYARVVSRVEPSWIMEAHKTHVSSSSSVDT